MLKRIIRLTWMFFDYYLSCLRVTLFDNKEITGLQWSEDDYMSDFDKRVIKLEKIFKEE